MNSMYKKKIFYILNIIVKTGTLNKNQRNDIKEMPPSKILQGRCVEPGASFHGKNKFFKPVFL